MHHTDRTALETSPYIGESQYAESTYQGEDEELVNPYSGEINQDLEVQLAAELLGVSSEDELDQFLGGFFKKVGRGFKKFARSGAGKAVFGLVKSAAKTAIPGLATAGAAMIPGAGPLLAPFAGQAAGALASGMGLEVEGMSNEDSQFEIARRVVRMGVDAARRIDALPEGEVMEEEIWSALASAARRHLPGAAQGILSQARSFARNTSGNLSFRGPEGWTFSAQRQHMRPSGQHEFENEAGASGQPPAQLARTGRWVRTKGGILLLGA